MWPACGPHWARQLLMHCVYRFKREFPRCRSATSLLLLATVIAALLPVPVSLPTLAQGKDRSKPFRCQDRPCGCRTAEQCRTQCCCSPKTHITARVKRLSEPAASPSVGTAKDSPAKCCSNAGASKSLSQRSHSPKSKPRTRSHQVILMIAAQECHGVAQAFSGQAVFVIPKGFSHAARISSVTERLVARGSLFHPRFAEPPIPPPRLCAL